MDLNRATAPDLELLPGIGPALSRRIVALRERRGGYARVDELVAVRGIGPRTVARLRPLVDVRSRDGGVADDTSSSPGDPRTRRP
ncbi:MAG: ComEA family DNA-binding protein [Sandaracinaceae bacterium]